jgi:pullulanase/glycogen debranching enzyme
MQVLHWHEQPMSALALVLHAWPHNTRAWWAINPSQHEQRFVLPEGSWTLMIDTYHGNPTPRMLSGQVQVPAQSVWVALAVSPEVRASKEFA